MRRRDSEQLALSSSACDTPLAFIRSHTKGCHQELETAIDWSRAFNTLEGYWRLLTTFHVLVEPLDRAIGACLRTHPPGFDQHLRTTHLRQDMERVAQRLGGRSWTQSALPIAPVCLADWSYIEDEATAIGSLYVIEGSALGGQYLRQQLRRCDWWTTAEGPDQLSPDMYFTGRGQEMPAHWRAFCNWLNGYLDPAHWLIAAEAAQRTFQSYHAHLSRTRYA